MHNQPFSMQLKKPPLLPTAASTSGGGWLEAVAALIMAGRTMATLHACQVPMRTCESPQPVLLSVAGSLCC